MPDEITGEDLLERVERIAPVIREHADLGEQQRDLADPIVDALKDAGLYHMLVPRELGGLQVDPLTFYQVVEELSRIDGSTGWCMFINGAAPFSGVFLRGEAAEEIFGNGARTIMSGTVFPFGRAVLSEGGYRVSGR